MRGFRFLYHGSKRFSKGWTTRGGLEYTGTSGFAPGTRNTKEEPAMKRLFPIIVAFVTALLVPAMLYAAGAAGFPSWSSKFTKGRFTVLPLFNGEAVLDKETGLVWERQPDGNKHTWFESVERCYVVNHGDRQGWRLPTMEELSSLVDSTQQSPAL